VRNCIHQPVFIDKDRAGIELREKTECLDELINISDKFHLF